MPTLSPLLQERIPRLPKVLAGPILRKTKKDSVSVWIALKESEQNLHLTIYSSNSNQELLTGQGATRAIGQHLHIAVITANQIVEDGNELESGIIYQYDISFGSDAETLSSPGILAYNANGIHKIVYGNYTRPSFVISPSTIPQLIILHGSCRKPHGGDRDALQAADIILSKTYDKAAKRPQQLMLTGDQIYADDVADCLMFFIQDANVALLGWFETPPLLSEEELQSVSNDRTDIIQEKAKMTSGEAKSHLIKLGEYYAMYLFAWSDVLWPTKEQIAAATTYYHYPKEQMDKVIILKDALPFIRKVLANIATYLVFDDHEITDDWFLNKEWSGDVLGNELARRIIQNGLSAYAVFQDWGNKPDYYNEQGLGPTFNSGYLLLEELEQLNANQGENLSDWAAICNRVVPTISGNKLSHQHMWHYEINFDAYQLIGLDTRTWRQFKGKKSTGLISLSQMSAQLPSRSEGQHLTILLSGTPVVGHYLMEEVLQPVISMKKASSADFEAWSFHQAIFQEMLRHLSTYDQALILAGDVHYGFSATLQYWDQRNGTSDQEHRARLIQLCSSSLKNSDSKTMLIGDHWAPISPYFLRTAAFLGWESPGVHMLSYESQSLLMEILKTIDPDLPIPDVLEQYVPFRLRLLLKRIHGTPAVRKLRIGDTIINPPQWRYRIDFVRDKRSQEERGLPSELISTYQDPRIGSQEVPVSDASLYTADALVVGKDNLGVVTFEWRDNDQKVIHEFYYVHKFGETNELKPYTRHEVSFNIPSANDPRPGE